MEKNTPIQQWIEDNDIVDIRFYPKNAAQSSVSDLLESAHSAVQAYESGVCYDYTDPVANQESEATR